METLLSLYKSYTSCQCVVFEKGFSQC